MSDTLQSGVDKIQNIVNDLNDALGPSGAGYEIDDIPFKDWSKVIRYNSELTAEQRQKVSEAVLSGDTIPEWSSSENNYVLRDYLQSQSAPAVKNLFVNGTGSEDINGRRLQECWRGDSGSYSEPTIGSLESVTISNVSSISGGSGLIDPASTVMLKEVSVINADECFLNHWGSNVEKVSYKDVSKIDDISPASQSLKEFTATGLTSVESSDGTAKSVLTFGESCAPNVERITLDGTWTGGISHTFSSNSQSQTKLGLVSFPYTHGTSSVFMVSGATIRNTGTFGQEQAGLIVPKNMNHTSVTASITNPSQSWKEHHTDRYELGSFVNRTPPDLSIVVSGKTYRIYPRGKERISISSNIYVEIIYSVWIDYTQTSSTTEYADLTIVYFTKSQGSVKITSSFSDGVLTIA